MKLFALLGAIALVALVNGAILPELANKIRYDNIALYGIPFMNKEQQNLFRQLAMSVAILPYRDDSNDSFGIAVGHASLEKFHEIVRQVNVTAHLIALNMQTLIDSKIIEAP